jgi:hypothetical protein
MFDWSIQKKELTMIQITSKHSLQLHTHLQKIHMKYLHRTVQYFLECPHREGCPISPASKWLNPLFFFSKVRVVRTVLVLSEAQPLRCHSSHIRCSISPAWYKKLHRLLNPIKLDQTVTGLICVRKVTSYNVGRNSSVGMATRYGLDGPGVETRWVRHFSHLSRPALGRT